MSLSRQVSVSAPPSGQVTEIGSGLWWTRIPLPFDPFHVNVYFIEGPEGWTVFDAGLDDEAGRNTWLKLLAGPLSKSTVTDIVVTHWHSDHLGLAGWLAELTGARLLMHPEEHARGLLQTSIRPGTHRDNAVDLFGRHGIPKWQLAEWLVSGLGYTTLISPVPRVYKELSEGDPLELNGRTGRITVMGGHTPASVGLRVDDGSVFLCGDQLSVPIFPAISVTADAPDADLLNDYLESMQQMLSFLTPQTLVLPGHGEPFTDAPGVIRRTVDYHRKSLDRIIRRLQAGALPVSGLLPELTRGDPGPVWRGFVAGRALAYMNYLEAGGHVRRSQQQGGFVYEATGKSAPTVTSMGFPQWEQGR
ncbi:MAG: MBL fold metallo-hydrolase [Actinomycetota bacterium]